MVNHMSESRNHLLGVDFAIHPGQFHRRWITASSIFEKCIQVDRLGLVSKAIRPLYGLAGKGKICGYSDRTG